MINTLPETQTQARVASTELPEPPAPWPRRIYRQIDVEYNPSLRTQWTWMKPVGIPCMRQDMIEELHHVFHETQQRDGHCLHDEDWHKIDYCVIGSRRPGVFNLGGDLALFIQLIQERNHEALRHYAKLCIDAMYPRIVGYQASVVTISLVQGDALGGGFEFALSSDVLVAEENVKLGLPEIIFNLFPGMGAYAFLARRVGSRKAMDLMMSGNMYRARELADMGIVDVVAPAGGGVNAVLDFIHSKRRHLNGMRSMYACRDRSAPITYQELLDVAMIWVDAALRLEPKDLQMMRRLVMSQRSLHEKAANSSISTVRGRMIEMAAA